MRGVSLWLEEWATFRFIPEQVIDLGERALMRIRLSGRAKASGIKLDQSLFHVWTFRDGLPWRCDVFVEEEQALEAAGLREKAMSEENVEIVRLAHERLNEGDIDGLIALCDGDFELDMSARFMNPETYRGHEGIRRFYREVREVWEEIRWEPLRFAAAADKVVVVMRDQGRGRGSGLEVARRGTAWGLDHSRAACRIGPLLRRSNGSPQSHRAAGVAALDEKRYSGRPGLCVPQRSNRRPDSSLATTGRGFGRDMRVARHQLDRP
jgi:ketosteroid isomerase-like protein